MAGSFGSSSKPTPLSSSSNSAAWVMKGGYEYDDQREFNSTQNAEKFNDNYKKLKSGGKSLVPYDNIKVPTGPLSAD